VLRDILGDDRNEVRLRHRAIAASCTVHIDGKRSLLLLPISAVRDRAVTPSKAWGRPAGAKVQKAWLALEVVQCGYCQSARSCRPRRCCGDPKFPMIPHRCAMAGNICVCGTYVLSRRIQAGGFRQQS